MGFRQVTVPYQRYRHSSARLLTRENPLTEISLIMIVDVSGHRCRKGGGPRGLKPPQL